MIEVTIKVTYEEQGRGICSNTYTGSFSCEEAAKREVVKFFGLENNPKITLISVEVVR